MSACLRSESCTMPRHHGGSCNGDPPKRRARPESYDILNAELNLEQAKSLQELADHLVLAKEQQSWEIVAAVATALADCAREVRTLGEVALAQAEKEGRL